jgi:ribosomal protein L15
MPKHRGFKRYYKLLTPVQAVNLDVIQKDEKITEVVSKEVLLQLGYIRTADVAVKVLGT